MCVYINSHTHTSLYPGPVGVPSALLGQRFQVLDIEPCTRGAVTLPGLIGFQRLFGLSGAIAEARYSQTLQASIVNSALSRFPT